ncbi:AMP-dependent synthetase/ligase [Rothia aerolata]|uniref:Acyl-CoA synthetase n=1 Tax=Rothia aerolata TaxID=1812262 RepID=A0A917MPH3_9MICC|nr:long-chain fatty acid--CoA ligase [Rothia aerolata]GGH56394.1 long-chain-fatty-acid--CoA ligase [Rothia aerolata]
MKYVSAPEALVSDPRQNITDILERRAADSSDPVLYKVQRSPGNWVPVRATEFRRQVTDLAKGLIASGIEAGDVVGIMSRTRYEWTLIDFAIWYAGAVSVPVYETSSPAQAAWALSHSEAKAVFVENEKLAEVISHCGEHEEMALEHTWVIDDGAIDKLVAAGADIEDDAVEARRCNANLDSIASIIYTSGTTGKPKGCPLTHGNFVRLSAQVKVAESNVAQYGNSTIIFLPLAHVLAREVQILAIDSGVVVGHSPDIKNLTSDLDSFKPTFLLVVPRVFEKIYEASIRKAEKGGRVNKALFTRAVTIAGVWSQAKINGHVSVWLEAQYRFYDKLVYSKLRAALGGRLKYAVSGGGALAPRLGHFFHSVGVQVIEGYGMTETCGSISVGRTRQFEVGNVGPLLPGAEARIAEDGELEVRGVGVIPHYYKNPEEDALAFTEDGWLRTGDLAEFDRKGFLKIVGRKKEIIVTAGGKNVIPGQAEDRLRTSALVSNAMLVGDEKPFVSALVTLDPDTLPDELEHLGLPRDMSMKDASTNPRVRDYIQKFVDDANSFVSKAEAIREFRITSRQWTEEEGHLTPSQKVKRSEVLKDFSALVEDIYQRTRESVQEQKENLQHYRAETSEKYQAFKAESAEKLQELGEKIQKKNSN